MDTLLHILQQRNPDTSTEELYARIVCGQIYVNNQRERQPAAVVAADAQIEYRRPRYVSRGGEKLHAALVEWQIEVGDKVFLDAGASSGGFSDCLLQFGARQVHAVDVGYNQLDYRLRRDPRVVVHERTNLMTLRSLDPAADAAVADLSFRSLRGAAARLLSLTREGWAIVLVKPQFELAARGKHPALDAAGGVVRGRALLLRTLLGLQQQLADEGVAVQRVLASPLRGRRGNQEFLFQISYRETPAAVAEQQDAAIRQRIHDEVRRLDRLHDQPNEERSSGSPM